MADAMKLLVRDSDDIKVASSLLQDALCAPTDMVYDKAAGEFMAVVNRFCWEQPVLQEGQDAEEGPEGPEGSDGHPVYARMMTGLRIGEVISVQQSRFDKRTEFYNLLAIEYEVSSSVLRLIFSANAEVKLQVSSLRMVLADLSPDYPTKARPNHDLGHDLGHDLETEE